MQKAWGCWEGRAGSPAAGQCRVLERGADKQFEEQTQRFVLVTLLAPTSGVSAENDQGVRTDTPAALGPASPHPREPALKLLGCFVYEAMGRLFLCRSWKRCLSPDTS